MGAYKWFIQLEFGIARLRDQNFTAENGQKVDDFEPMYLGKYRYW